MRRSFMSAALAVLSLGVVAAGTRVDAAARQDATTLGSGAAMATGRTARDADAARLIPADASTMRVATEPEGGPTRAHSEEFAAPAPDPSPRSALAQPGCTICLEGSGSVSWVGSSGSYHVDGIGNFRSSGTSGTLDLRVALSSSLPVFGQSLSYYTFSDVLSFSQLDAGFHYAPVNSGTVGFYPGTPPPGLYWVFLYLREYQGGGVYQYTDFMLMNNRVSCNGASCNAVASCTEDAYTMCLVGGRYRVTSRWRNQYAGGAQANLAKVKLTDYTGAFWIADSSSYEYLIRFNTSTDNGRAWVAIPTFTDVEFWITVTDTLGGQSREYHSLPGNRTLIFDPSYFVYP